MWWIGESLADGRRTEGGRGLIECLNQLAAELGDEVAQCGDGAGWVGAWRGALTLETARAGLESFLSAGREDAPPGNEDRPAAGVHVELFDGDINLRSNVLTPPG